MCGLDASDLAALLSVIIALFALWQSAEARRDIRIWRLNDAKPLLDLVSAEPAIGGGRGKADFDFVNKGGKMILDKVAITPKEFLLMKTARVIDHEEPFRISIFTAGQIADRYNFNIEITLYFRDVDERMYEQKAIIVHGPRGHSALLKARMLNLEEYNKLTS